MWNRQKNDFPFLLLNCDRIIGDIPLQSWTRHNFKYCTVEYVMQGEGIVEQNGMREHIDTDCVFFLHKYGNHCFWPVPENPWHKVFFIVDGALMESLTRAYKLDQIFLLRNAQVLRRHFDAMESLRQSQPDMNERAAVIFHEFACDCARFHSGPEPVLPPIVAALKQVLDASERRKFELGKYAGDVGVSAAHLIRAFSRYCGATPGEYLLRQRIESAKRMLLYSSGSVKEIAAELCFSDQYYFSNYFKRHVGVSPSEYRRKAFLSDEEFSQR